MRIFCGIVAIFLAACPAADPPAERSPTPSHVAPAPQSTPYTDTGDLAALQKHGKLRVLLPTQGTAAYLPRRGFPSDLEREAASDFAKSVGLEVEWIYVENHADLIPYLLDGKGDVVAANLTVTKERKRRVAFTVPLTRVREQAVVKADDTTVKRVKDLQGRSIAVRRSSSFWGTVKSLQRKYSQIELEPAPENLDTEQILHQVAEGAYDVTIADSNLVTAVLTYRNDLRVACDISGERAIAWAVRPDSKKLRRKLDDYLNEAKLAMQRESIYKADFNQIKKRRVIRVLTRNSAATYFLWRGELLGFEYELAREFGKRHNVRVELVVPPKRDDLLTWLKEGRGDVVAAALTQTTSRLHDPELAWSRPYSNVSEIVVKRTGDELDRIEQLAGRTIVVRKSSSYWESLKELQKNKGLKFKLQAAPEDMETEEIIKRVGTREYDLTVSDSHILDIELTWRRDVTAAFPLGDPVPHGWATRVEDKRLLEEINKFFKQEYRGLFYNLAYEKYFKNERKIRKHVEFRADRGGALSPYDDHVRKYADQYGFDWRLIVAQMYQESRFDPEARSWVGAMGLMQVMPRTAKELGFDDVIEPENAVHAGVKYMSWVRERFEPELSVKDRTWFALASYNAGYGHVLDARRLAAQKGWDSDRWFDNTERAMLLLSKPKYARRARYGYARGAEPVKYVREISERYDAYVRATKVQ